MKVGSRRPCFFFVGALLAAPSRARFSFTWLWLVVVGNAHPTSSPGFRRVGGPADRLSVSWVRTIDTVLFSSGEGGGEEKKREA
jgi:hypothetical protein